MKNIRFFLFENFQFLEVEFSIYSNRNVFVMHMPEEMFLHDTAQIKMFFLL